MEEFDLRGYLKNNKLLTEAIDHTGGVSFDSFDDEIETKDKEYYINALKHEVDLAKKMVERYDEIGREDFDLLKSEILDLAKQSKLNMEPDIVGWEEFLENNRDNDLPDDSSGSLRTALYDIDNIFANVEMEIIDSLGEDTLDEIYTEIADYMRLNIK